MSIHKIDTPAGTRYRAKWRENGRQRSRTFNRKSDAQAFDLEIRRRQQLGPLAVSQLTTTGPTLSEWIADRWTPEHGPTITPGTLTTYRLAYAKHVQPWLGNRPVKGLTVSVLREWQADRLAHGVGPGALVKTRTFLSSVLRHAAEAEVIPSNPLSLVRAPKVPRKDETRPLAPSSIEEIRFHMADRDAALIAVLAYAGLRPGEALALRWQHIGERTVTVNATKTGQRRSVRLLAPLAADLQAWHKASGRPAPGALVFPGTDGRPWTREAYKSWSRPAAKAKLGTSPTRLARTAGPFHRATIAAGIDRTTPYALRHSFASLLLAEGRNVIYVARQLGHSAEMTLTVYGHVLAEFEDAPQIDAEHEIRKARVRDCSLRVPSATG